MRRLALFPLLLAVFFLGACNDVAGLSGRSMDGRWSTYINGEEVWISLRDSGGDIRGSGEWGFDQVTITGDRRDSDVYLVFEFDYYNPIELEGVIANRDLEGRLYGSGLEGDRVRFRRQ